MKETEKVMKSNALVESLYDINLVAQRLVILTIIQARNSGTIESASGVHRIYAVDYAKNFIPDSAENKDYSGAYKALRSACDNLYESEFIWKSRDEKGRIKHNRSRFVQRASYVEGAGYVEVMFGHDVIPLITRLGETYTEYELHQIKNLKSEYALRVFEIVMQWASVGATPYIEIGELRGRLGIPDSKYKNICDLKKRVLKKAITEINANTNINVQFEQQKTGVKITGFRFKFKFDKPKKLKDVSSAHEKNSIEGLSDPQLGRITRSPLFINDYASRIAPNSSMNQDMTAWSAHFVQELKKDASKFNKRPIRDYLDY